MQLGMLRPWPRYINVEARTMQELFPFVWRALERLWPLETGVGVVSSLWR